MRFVTLFPKTENIHLIKDVGMIPFIMHKSKGYDSYVATYNNGEYPYLDTAVKGLKLQFIKKVTRYHFIDSILYLISESKKIDILQLYHMTKKSYVHALLYKLINRNGIVYLKLDASNDIKNMNFSKNTVKGNIQNRMLRFYDLVSVETKDLQRYLNEKYKFDIKYIPNGFYDNGEKKHIGYDKKDNVILTVGRIGTYEKANEVLLEAFLKCHDKIDSKWKLKLVGPIDEKFSSYIDKYKNTNPEIQDRVFFSGPIYDRDKLDFQYETSKVFVMTSKFESFGLVFLEALKAGCYILTTDVTSARDITCNERYGSIVPVDSIDSVADQLVKICNNEQALQEKYDEIIDFAYDNFYWEKIIEKLDYEFMKIKDIK